MIVAHSFEKRREGAMRRASIVLVLGLAAGSALAQSKEPILLREMGSFHIGGRVIGITGQPIKEVVFTPGGVPAKMDPNGKYQVEQMYVQYFLPQNRKGKVPVVARRRVDGRDLRDQARRRRRLAHLFPRKGWDTYVSDAVERGRAGWTNTFKGDAMALPLGDPWERFRIGPPGSWNDDKAKRATYSGVQFPTEAYEQFMKQGVPRWLTTDDQIVAAYIELVDKICPCVVLVHSQSGSFGYKVLEARPDKVKALVAVEPTLGGDRNKVQSIKTTPILVLYGDNAKDHPRWSKIRQSGIDYCRGFQSRGRQHRCRRPAGCRPQGQFAHDDDGQEQRSGCRADPEMARRQGTGGMMPVVVNLSCTGRSASRVNRLKTRAPSKNASLKRDGSPDQARQRRGTGSWPSV
jgi:pimeloyl-ACP methyl ester carboxylesterase